MSKGSGGSKVVVEINQGKIQFHPLLYPLNGQQLLTVFERFVRAVREGKAANPDVMGDRLIVAVLPYDSTTDEGGTIRLTVDGAWVAIAPTDFLMMLLNCLTPTSTAYPRIMDMLLPHIQGGNGTLEERAAACLRSLAGSGTAQPRT